MTKQEPRAFATASPDFSGEMGSCVSANTKNLGTIDPSRIERQAARIHEYWEVKHHVIYTYIWLYIYDILFYNYSQNYNTLDIDT